jgi:hypothetical protein
LAGKVRLFGRERPPQAVLELLEPDERVLSWADTSIGSAVVATPMGLWWPAAEGHRRIGWQHVDKAVWRDSMLVVTEADVVDGLLLVDRPPVAAHLATPRDLPPTVRKRIEANVVRSDLVAVPGGEARLVARRVPGQDGLHWWARLEVGTADTPAVREVLSQLREARRAAWEAEVRG